MKTTTLHVHYCTGKHIEGFKFLNFKAVDGDKDYLYLGDVEVVNPFNAPDNSIIISAQVNRINDEIIGYKAKINLLENQAKDLLCIELVD